MSTWLSLARTAPGTMIELVTHRTSGRCLINGAHTPTWRTDVVGCRYCRHTFREATDAFYAEVSSPEGMAVVLSEAEARLGL